jgi:hypothetical protein
MEQADGSALLELRPRTLMCRRPDTAKSLSLPCSGGEPVSKIIERAKIALGFDKDVALVVHVAKQGGLSSSGFDLDPDFLGLRLKTCSKRNSRCLN